MKWNIFEDIKNWEINYDSPSLGLKLFFFVIYSLSFTHYLFLFVFHHYVASSLNLKHHHQVIFLLRILLKFSYLYLKAYIFFLYRNREFIINSTSIERLKQEQQYELLAAEIVHIDNLDFNTSRKSRAIAEYFQANTRIIKEVWFKDVQVSNYAAFEEALRGLHAVTHFHFFNCSFPFPRGRILPQISTLRDLAFHNTSCSLAQLFLNHQSIVRFSFITKEDPRNKYWQEVVRGVVASLSNVERPVIRNEEWYHLCYESCVKRFLQ